MNDDWVLAAALVFEQRNSLSVEDIRHGLRKNHQRSERPDRPLRTAGGVTSYLMAAGGAIGSALRTACCSFYELKAGRSE